MTGKNKKVFLLVLLFILIFIFVFSRRVISPTKSITGSIAPTVTTTSVPEKITKCQNVIVSGSETVELFTYQSGKFTRFDYRVAAMSEEKAINLQILSDGQWLYVWNRPLRYSKDDVVANPPGKKTKLSNNPLTISPLTLGEVRRVNGASISGDRLCNIWDDVDPVFTPPGDFSFEDSIDTTQKLRDDLTKICQICTKTTDDAAATACRNNLSCL